MKNIYIVWIIISFIILSIVGYSVLNAFVSLKYEVESSRVAGIKDANLDDKENLLNDIVFILKVFGAYLVINISILLRWLYKNSLMVKE